MHDASHNPFFCTIARGMLNAVFSQFGKTLLAWFPGAGFRHAPVF
jgi:hypothetical protein